MLSGSARLKLDDDILELSQWDAVRIPPGTMRAWHAGPEGFEVLAIGAPVFDKTDAEMVQGWWDED